MRRASSGPVLVMLLALLVIGAAAALVAGSAPNDNDPSSRSAGNAGTLALYQWLSRLGFAVSRVSGQFDPRSADVLIVQQPSTAFSPAEAAEVAETVRDGGELILTADRVAAPAAAELLDTVGAETSPASLTPSSQLPASFDATAALPVDPAGAVHRVPMKAGLAFDVTPSGGVPLLTAKGQAVGVAIPVGSGRAFVLGSPYPLSNLGLRQGDSAALVLALIERAHGGRIAFDEYHHGEAGVGGAQAALSGPVGLAGGLAALAILAFLGLSGRRLGRPVPAADPSRVPSATEYVDAMGALIERTAERGAVATRYAEELKRKVGAATAIDSRLDDEVFLALLDAHDAPATPPVRAALARCRTLAAARPNGAQLVALAREVDEVEKGFAVGATSRLA